ncbi:precorrin-4/cobalt-precorrin-4 C11-methyltransferase [Lachnospiraceae bacterium C10]|jgi:precorrin-4/cobalt-precorrin-4 C11-methyltransferase|nr:precorrin-4/cobalt-precorrin-4 C11-methyltransferase [Lachnospiraceae bacterium C10]SDW67926.1 cobalt-precorrin 4 C11-methyltransferase [Lachnospiraceae bacterium KHCPX20]
MNKKGIVHFVGAGCGSKDLITVRGANLLKECDSVIYAGSLVNPELLAYCPTADVYNSAYMTLEEIIEQMQKDVANNRSVVRLHTGDPSLYGAIREQMDALRQLHIPYDSCPGVSACFGAAASMNLEYTLPGISQSLIITRMEGRTAVPAGESIESFAAHEATMAIYLSASMLEELSRRLIKGGYPANTPAAIVYKASWPEEQIYSCTVERLAATGKEHGITKTALILVGKALDTCDYETSRLYAADFSTEYRRADV